MLDNEYSPFSRNTCNVSSVEITLYAAYTPVFLQFEHHFKGKLPACSTINDQFFFKGNRCKSGNPLFKVYSPFKKQVNCDVQSL